ncbi:MAG: AAA family ATPase [Bacteroidia bacterium]|nr:AAA family ATPase [Bacteroidia bacterium]
MKKLPIGKQDFAKLIGEDYVYVDKTEFIYRMISSGSVYFLSRPRRFGKSLTVTALKEIFSGNKELFKELWIYDKIEWKPYPVLCLDFSEIDYQQQSLYNALDEMILDIAADFDIMLSKKTVKAKFFELIKVLSKDTGVVILIDEYDKPIIDYIDEKSKAEKNRKILKYFYSALKGADKYIRFLFITGVSKFSKVSIFSDLNHLNDITIDKNYACLAGITEDELQIYFDDYMSDAQQELQQYCGNVHEAIRDWYNGYKKKKKNFVPRTDRPVIPDRLFNNKIVQCFTGNLYVRLPQ